MATSGSTNYSETTQTIVKDALTSIGALEPGEDPEHEPFQFAQRTLNRMIKAWQAKGRNLWRDTEGSITLVADQQSYTMGGTGSPDFAYRPLRISQMRFVDSSGTESPEMIQISREEYFGQPTKGAQGTSTQFYYDPQRSQGKLYIWPVLSSVTTEAIKFTYQRAFDDFDATTDEPDIPQEWFDAIVLNLAAKLCTPTFPGVVQIKADIKADAMEALETALDFDEEWADIEFTRGDRGR